MFNVDVGREQYFARGPAGQWYGKAAEALACQGPVELAALRSLLGGAHPRTELPLEGLSRRRSRAGYELIVAAPKSISLLATLGSDGRAGLLNRAHGAAVADALSYLETRTPVVRHKGELSVSDGWAMAAFTHRRNAAGEPHLHTHVVVANVVASSHGWRCLSTGPPLWEQLQAADARYFVALDAHLRANGLFLEWERTASGAREVAGVPRAAVEAASSRRTEILANADARQGGREVARRITHDRRPNAPWPAAVAAAGFDGRRAAAVFDRATSARPVPATAPQIDLAAVEDELLVRGSLFRKATAMEVVATTAPSGTTLAMLEQWTEQVCARATPRGGGLLLSPNAEHADQRVAAAALGRREVGVGVAASTQALARRTIPLDPTGAAALDRLVRAGHGVDVLGPGATRVAPILAQAAVLDAARVAWQAAGHRVAILPGPDAEDRWRALTGLGSPSPDSPRPTVLVVDRADRMATPQLAALLDQAARQATKVVLLAGGSAPARTQPRSGALARFIEQCPPIEPGRGPEVEAICHPALPLGPQRMASLSGTDAVGHLVAAWASRQSGPSAVMVAGGWEEVGALNQAARRQLLATGTLRGPDTTLGQLALREGERVMTLTRGAGALGTVIAVDKERASVRWDTGLTSTLDSRGVRDIGYGYATTPAMVRPGRHGPSVLLGLGPQARLSTDDRLVRSFEVAPTQTRALFLSPERLWRAARQLDAGGTGPLPVEQPAWQLEREQATLTRHLLAQPMSPEPNGLEAWARAHRPELDRWVNLATAIDARRDLEAAQPALERGRAHQLTQELDTGLRL